jgi:hypothetical protein
VIHNPTLQRTEKKKRVKKKKGVRKILKTFLTPLILSFLTPLILSDPFDFVCGRQAP